MKLLKNIPGFLTEIAWSDHRNSFYTVNIQRLFPDSDLFIVPEGTLVERFTYQGMDLTKFAYSFSFFTLLEQFTKSLTINRFEFATDWYCSENVAHMVQISYNFIIHILKYYQGDFKSDIILRRLIQHLEILAGQIPEGSIRHYAFIKLYFELNCTIISRKLMDFAEVFPPLVRKKYFPQTISLNKVNKQIFLNKIHNGSILLRNLKLEENKPDHSLLILYLKLVQDMIEVSIFIF